MAAASQESHLGPVSDHSILLFRPRGNSVAFLDKLMISDIVYNIIFLVTQKNSLSMFFPGVLDQIADRFCVFLSNHNLPHLKW